MLQEQKIYCLQVHPYIFQPGNFTGWGSEGVKKAEACNGQQQPSLVVVAKY